MEEKRDYSPVVDERGDAETRRQRRFARALFLGAHTFWIYALLLAGLILLVIYLAGGFGEGGGDRGAQAVAATSTEGTSPQSSSRR